MPPLVFHPVLNTVEVVSRASRGGKERLNVYHYNYGGSPRPTGSDLSALVDDIEGSILGVTGVPNNTATGTTWIETIARDIHDAGGAIYVRAESIGAIWANSADNSNVSHCLTKRTGVPGRAHRGRWYLFDLGEDAFNEDLFNPVLIVRWIVMTNHIAASRVGGRFKPAVASKLLGLSTLIQAITFDFVADSQRRRLQGRGA